MIRHFGLTGLFQTKRWIPHTCTLTNVAPFNLVRYFNSFIFWAGGEHSLEEGTDLRTVGALLETERGGRAFAAGWKRDIFPSRLSLVLLQHLTSEGGVCGNRRPLQVHITLNGSPPFRGPIECKKMWFKSFLYTQRLFPFRSWRSSKLPFHFRFAQSEFLLRRKKNSGTGIHFTEMTYGYFKTTMEFTFIFYNKL